MNRAADNQITEAREIADEQTAHWRRCSQLTAADCLRALGRAPTSGGWARVRRALITEHISMEATRLHVTVADDARVPRRSGQRHDAP